MKNTDSVSSVESKKTGDSKVSLQQLVSRLMTGLLPLSAKRGNLMINDIPRDLVFDIDEDMLAYVLWNLMSSAVKSTQNECLRIEAVNINDRIMVQISHAGIYFYHTISGKYRQVQYVAGMLGGNISVDNDGHCRTNVSLNIANILVAA